MIPAFAARGSSSAEFVAADAGQRVFLAQYRTHALRNLTQERIAGSVTERCR